MNTVMAEPRQLTVLPEPSEDPQTPEELASYATILAKKTYNQDQLGQMIDRLNGQSLKSIYEGVIGLRKLLSIEVAPPIQQVIDRNIIPRMMDLMAQDLHPHLKFECMWIVTNLLSGSHDQCETVVKKGVIPILVQALDHSSADISQQAIWALGNIAGDNAVYRNTLLKLGTLTKLIKCLQRLQSNSQMKNIVWAASNLCRGKPKPEFKYIKEFVPPLNIIFSKLDLDKEVYIDAAWALSYICDTQEGARDILSCGLAKKLVPFMHFKMGPAVEKPILRIFSEIFLLTEGPSQMLDFGLVDTYGTLLKSYKSAMRKQAAYGLSNLATEKEYIKEIVNHPSILFDVMRMFKEDSIDIRKELAFVLGNSIDTLAREFSREDVVEFALKCRFLDLMVCGLQIADKKINEVVVQSLQKLFEWQQKDNRLDFMIGFRDLNGLYALDSVLESESRGLLRKAQKLRDTLNTLNLFQKDDQNDNNLQKVEGEAEKKQSCTQLQVLCQIPVDKIKEESVITSIPQSKEEEPAPVKDATPKML